LRLAVRTGDIMTEQADGAAPARQERNEITPLDAVVAKIAGDQSDAAVAQRLGLAKQAQTGIAY
jgi:hypothetical protein